MTGASAPDADAPDGGIGIVGIVGAGVMGAGIAQVAIEADREVVLYDVDEVATDRGRARIREGLARRAERLALDADAIDDWTEGRLARLRIASTLDALAAEADLVIESVLEDLDLKRSVFRTLDGEADPVVILATNTSALRVADIAASTTRPERVVGLHFFNPVPRMALVEVAATDATDPDVVARVVSAMTAWGKVPVVCADMPGFIVNRVNRPFTIEALRMLEDGTATVEAIDAAMREAGFPLGPFELVDLTGADINHAAATGVWEGLGRPDRLRPSPITARLVEEGRLGRKAGRGFYRYEDGRRVAVEPDLAVPATGLAPDGAASASAIQARIIGAIDAEARRAVADGVADEASVDLALRAGAGHPVGPFERARSAAGASAPSRMPAS